MTSVSTAQYDDHPVQLQPIVYIPVRLSPIISTAQFVTQYNYNLVWLHPSMIITQYPLSTAQFEGHPVQLQPSVATAQCDCHPVKLQPSVYSPV